MESKPHDDRVRAVFQMLFEMATGNFNFRIRISNDADEFDNLVEILNNVAAALEQTILDSGQIIPHFTYQSLVETTFVLDKNFIIEGLSSNVSDLLGYPHELLFNIPFKDILSLQSTELCQKIIEEAEHEPTYHNTVQLIFIAANTKIVPAFCTVSKLLFTNRIFISSITTILQDIASDKVGQLPITARPLDAQIIQKVHDYILNHLEDPLPSSKELSKIFGTNEFKIKDGFRHFFNTSVYQFYNDERLKKAHLLIQQTYEPLKSIAFSCGFSDYTNFYKAFKKRFGYPPSDLHRTDE